MDRTPSATARQTKKGIMKISRKLTLTFAAIATLSVLSGLVGVLGLLDANDKSITMFQKYGNTQGMLGYVSASFQEIQTSIRDLLLDHDATRDQEYVSDIADADKVIDQYLQDFSNAYGSTDSSVGRLQTAVSDYRTMRDKVVNLALAGQDEEALQELNSQDMDDVVSSASTVIKNTINSNISTATALEEAQSAQMRKSIILLGAIFLLLLLLSVILGTRLTRNISQPLSVIASGAEKIAAGDISTPFDIHSNDEIGILATAFNHIIASVGNLVDDVHLLSDAAVAGNFSIRADVEQHQGDFRRIVEGVNSTLDSVVTPINEAMDVLQRMSDNDYTLKMEGQYAGLPQQMARSINETRERLLSVQSVLIEIAQGDTGRLEYFRNIGRRSENDQLVPAVVTCMATLETLVEGVNALSAAAAAGNLDERVDASGFQGRYRQMIGGVNSMLDAVAAPLSEAVTVLSAMAGNDYTSVMSQEYDGAFRTLAESVNAVSNTLNQMLWNLADAAEQISAGTRQVSEGSQALSQGATEQAGAIEELSASAADIAGQTKRNAADAGHANTISMETRAHALTGNSHMSEMLDSMNEINEASIGISRIIKVIDDIAFQTNLLALNAAVEAARAGQHGKGFAVVAEEVRNLAARSANAAKETTAMIEGSMQKATEGMRIANETAQALGKIVEGVEQATNLVSAITRASQDQATAVAQVNRGIEQVSQVVQTNSATAEESAAMSEELSGQAELLKEMVGRFHLKDRAPAKAAQRALPSAREKARPRISLSDQDFGKY